MSVNRVQQQTAASKLTDPRSPYTRVVAKIAGPLVVLLVVLACSASPALAANAPVWNITAMVTPTYLTPNGTGAPRRTTEVNELGGNEITVTVHNLAETPVSGAVIPIRLALSLHGVTFAGPSLAEIGIGFNSPVAPVAGCTAGSSEPCVVTYTGTLEPFAVVRLRVQVATGAPGTATSTATVSGGEVSGVPVASASMNQQLVVSSSRAPFGIQPGSVLEEFVGADGAPETQADAHPYDLAVDFALNNYVGHANLVERVPVEDMKDVAVELPPGVAGNELALAQCASVDLALKQCSGSSQVGTLRPMVTAIAGVGTGAIFNLKPDNGRTNELGFVISLTVLRMPTTVRTNSDYGITNITPNIDTAQANVVAVESDIWGVPGDHSHDRQRVLVGSYPNGEAHASALPPSAFFTMPSQCGVPLVYRIVVDSWNHPGRKLADGSPDLSDSNWKVTTVTEPPLTGCETLQSFAPKVAVAPATTFADTPSGTTVDVSVPQGEALTSPNELATPTLQNTKVTLPAGLVINPGQANGLAACQFSEDGVGTVGPPSCPGSSKVGTVEIETPLLPDKLEGNVYVLQSNPPDVQLLVAASGDGVNFKLVGHVHLNEQTGQLTSTFDGTPALPFSHFRLIFSGGAQAALSTPPSCGLYASMSDFTPWSSPLTPDALANDAFAISSGPGGSPCASPLPFSPSLIAGATTDQAGGYTSFSLLLSRADGQQRIGGLQFKTPEGLLGMIGKIPLCEEPQAAAGTCSADSQIGHTVVGAGAGPDPLYVPEAGQSPAPIYLTGSYRGAPFGLSIVVPVIAGPFNLGTVVVRAAINVDPSTSRLTISTDPLPLILDGIPTDLRQINTVIDRPEFMFNPTSCAPEEFSGIAQSAEGAVAPISSRFQVGSCQSLTFKPNFKVSTQGLTSRASGASLDARVVYPTGALGANQASSQSNIASVKVELPKQLPSRLTTLQKACTAAQFEADPAGCPVASRIGVVKAITPVLPVPLTGPVYFVSHGGEAFPSLIAVMQGYGVRVDLVASTFISTAGITSSTFKQIPDVPIASFELYLPEGPYSALGANGNLCTSTLKMPTTFVAQNGAVIHQSTPIEVTGCKPAIRAVGHSVKGSHASISVTVPSGGTLVATGSDIERSVRHVGKAGTVAIGVTLHGHDLRVLAKNPHQHVNVMVKLRFTRKHGAPLTAYVRLLMG
jgi:hypothetical protein